MRHDTPEICELEDAVRDFDPVYAIRRNGAYVRTSSGQIKRFASREGARSYIANCWASGYKVVRYS